MSLWDILWQKHIEVVMVLLGKGYSSFDNYTERQVQRLMQVVM